MIAQAVTGTPGHINAMATCMHPLPGRSTRPRRSARRRADHQRPLEDLRPLHDITVVTPVFREAGVVAFFGNTCHLLDIGGRGLSADARAVYEEGLLIPITKLYDAGRAQRGAAQDPARQRARAGGGGGRHLRQVGGNDVGARRLLRVHGRVRARRHRALADEIIARSERAMRAAIAAVPDGVYRNELTIDGYEQPVELRRGRQGPGRRADVDYAGQLAREPAGINVVLNYTARLHDLRPEVRLCAGGAEQRGQLPAGERHRAAGLHPQRAPPAPVAARHIIGHFLPGASSARWRRRCPERVMAEGVGQHLVDPDHRRSAENGASLDHLVLGGRHGRPPDKDGLSATAFPSGISGVPAEVIESLSPIVVRRRELRQDSGGAGTFRGGLGQVMEIEVLTDEPYVFSGLYERTRHAAPGLQAAAQGPAAASRPATAFPCRRRSARSCLPAPW